MLSFDCSTQSTVKHAPDSFLARALPCTPLWELAALPQTPSWFKGDPTSKWRGGERGRTGSAPAFVLIPLLYFSVGNDSVL